MKPLKKINNEIFYFIDEVKTLGVHSGIYGDVTDIRGDVTEIKGNFDEIPMEERKEKPNVSDWVDLTD